MRLWLMKIPTQYFLIMTKGQNQAMQLQWHNFEAKHAPSSSVMFKWLKYKTLWLLQSCQISLQSLCSSLFKIRITTHCVESPSIIVQVEIRNSKRKLVKQIPAETNICFSSFVRSPQLMQYDPDLCKAGRGILFVRPEQMH